MFDAALRTFFISWRSIWRHRRRTLLTVAAVTFGLSIALMLEAFGWGFYSQMIRDGVRMQSGHVTILHDDYLDAPASDLFVAEADPIAERLAKNPLVAGVKRTVLAQGIAQSAEGAVGVSMVGVDVPIEREWSPLPDRIIEGEYLEDGDLRGIVVGRGLADRLDISIGRRIVLSTNDIHGELVDNLFRVRGIFETGADAMDVYLVQVDRRALVGMLNMPEGSATQIGVIVEDPDDVPAVLADARSGLPEGAVAEDWKTVMPELDRYIQADYAGLEFMNALLIIVCLFTVLNTMMMSVVEREKEFAVLMAVGTSTLALRAQLLMEAAMIALLGCLAGAALGGLGAQRLATRGLDMSSLYGSEEMSISGFAVDFMVYGHLRPDAALDLLVIVFIVTVLTVGPALVRVGRIDLIGKLR